MEPKTKSWLITGILLIATVLVAFGVKALEKFDTPPQRYDISVYTTTMGKVVSVAPGGLGDYVSRVKPDFDQTILRITYEYTVNGRQYENDRYSFASKAFSPIGDLGGFARWMYKFRIGSEHIIYYNRNFPRDSLMDPTVPLENPPAIWPWIFVWLFGFFTVISIPPVFDKIDTLYNRFQDRGTVRWNSAIDNSHDVHSAFNQLWKDMNLRDGRRDDRSVRWYSADENSPVKSRSKGRVRNYYGEKMDPEKDDERG
ncbi:MAG: hypothetical protein KKB30_05470 [Proteobacteria bacterium]|nr:hypothetical protein [Pseudomonadota bacterium]MBU1716149.1 hypothetical protein [Pseudomonadota bacterium]